MNPRLHAALLLLGIAVVVAIMFWPRAQAESLNLDIKCGQLVENGPLMCLVDARAFKMLVDDHAAAVKAALACGVWKTS